LPRFFAAGRGIAPGPADDGACVRRLRGAEELREGSAILYNRLMVIHCSVMVAFAPDLRAAGAFL